MEFSQRRKRLCMTKESSKIRCTVLGGSGRIRVVAKPRRCLGDFHCRELNVCGPPGPWIRFARANQPWAELQPNRSILKQTWTNEKGRIERGGYLAVACGRGALIGRSRARVEDAGEERFALPTQVAAQQLQSQAFIGAIGADLACDSERRRRTCAGLVRQRRLIQRCRRGLRLTKGARRRCHRNKGEGEGCEG